MIRYTRGKIEQILKIDFIRFCIVGGTGFVINFIILEFLTKAFSIPAVFAQLVGAEVALFSNFTLHNRWTYKGNNVKKPLKTLLLQFHATSWPAIVGSSLMVGAGVSFLHMSKLVALIITSALVLAWNFYWSKFVIWRGVTEKEVEKGIIK